jgi:thioredoxin 1
MNPVLDMVARDYKVCKVNVDKNQELAAQYGVSSIPALFIFYGGQIVTRFVGVTSEEALRSELERFKRPIDST